MQIPSVLESFELSKVMPACSDTVNGWPVQHSETIEQRLNTLDRAIREETYKQINSVIVVREGKLLYERYYNGSKRDDTHDPMSAARDPGDEWRYFTAGVVVAGDILNQVLPGGFEAYAHKHLFEALGITNYQWQHTPQRVANTDGGIRLTPLDFAKFGELHRNEGMWRGKRVLPARWVRESLEPLVETTVDGERYGRLWWHKIYPVNGTAWETSFCSGNGGNKIFVFPGQDLVVVITASAHNQRFAHTQVDEMMVSHILPAVATSAR